jgi:hypothetical protein
MLLVVDNPDDVPNFMRHSKTESVHMINGLLGRDMRTLWCEEYDSRIVLTPLRALAFIAYMYANPAKVPASIHSCGSGSGDINSSNSREIVTTRSGIPR